MASKPVKPRRLKARPKKGSLKSLANALPWDPDVPSKDSKSTPHVLSPVSYAGKWIGWTPDARKIVASGPTPQKVLALAKEAGYPRVILERVPRNLEPIQEKSDS
jgi:Family of unknown function (DUF5678)